MGSNYQLLEIPSPESLLNSSKILSQMSSLKFLKEVLISVFPTFFSSVETKSL